MRHNPLKITYLMDNTAAVHHNLTPEARDAHCISLQADAARCKTVTAGAVAVLRLPSTEIFFAATAPESAYPFWHTRSALDAPSAG
jgi:hypothetical protein